MPARSLLPEPIQDNPQLDQTALGLRLGNMIAAAGLARRVAYANQTFGDFVAAAKELGVKDSDVLSSIEFGVSQYGSGLLQADRDDSGAVELREVRR